MAKEIVPSGYQKLIAEIGRLYEDARAALARTYWEIGRRIVEIEQDGDVRARYGDGLLQSLSDDLSKKYGKGFSVTNIANMRRFYLTHKKFQAPEKLAWTKYVELLSVDDPAKREQLERRAAKENLPARKLRQLAREAEDRERRASGKKDAPAKKIPPLKRPTGLKLYTYRKIGSEILPLARSASAFPLAPAPASSSAASILVDCGFYVYRFVRKTAVGFEVVDKPAYTYLAVVERVIDGDTLGAFIDIGFNARVREKLRLRGIDAPELGTPEGEAAKKYVEGILPPGGRLILKTYRSDLHGRFVADVFYTVTPPGGVTVSFDDLLASTVYLNQELLDKGFAVRAVG